MASTSMAIPILVIRVIALLALAGAVALMVTNNEKSDEISFKDLYAYRYVVAAGVVGFAYSLLQLPFAVYYVATGKRMIKNGLFDFFGDKIMSWFLATAVGAGIAVTYELKKLLGALLGSPDDEESKLDEFLNRGYISTGVLAVAFFCLAILSVLSSLSRNPSSSKGFFG
ncbi:hypothetical protein QQ045_015284 [Rhodiola kirilowii]